MTGIEEKIIKPKLGLSELAKQLGSASQACKVMDYSRDRIYRFKELYEQSREARVARLVDTDGPNPPHHAAIISAMLIVHSAFRAPA